MLLSLALAALASSAQVRPAIAPDTRMEARIETLLHRMTLDEKVGQMCELTIDAVTDFTAPSTEFRLSEEKLAEVIGRYKVGSILNVPRGVAQKPEVWAATIRRIQEVSMQTMGIPCIYGVDQIHGTTYTRGGTLFPQGINMAATLRPDLVTREAEISAYETRACCIPWTYAPVMDLGRDPRWPRMWESFGEDCYINARMASAAVRGYQGADPNRVDDRHVAVSLKHFMGYGVPVSGKDRTPSAISPMDLREKHFAPFLECIRGGALTLMVNSGVNNGVPFHANRELLTGWVKEQLGWDGMIVTDWADIDNLCTRDHIAATKKDAIEIAINAGIDMSMVPYSTEFCTWLRELVEEGRVPMSRIDDAVRRVLRLKMRLGLFERPYWDISRYEKFGSEEHAAVAREAAEESIVLLKNENALLPLRPGKKILLTGPNANSMRCLLGGWSYSWQGDKADDYAGAYHTIYEAMARKYGEDRVVLEQGVTYVPGKNNWWRENEPQIEKAVAAARDVDVIVACVGENSYCETPGNLTDLNLSPAQKALVRALAATGKPLVLILNEGRPRIIGDIEPLAGAVVDIMLPGNYGADALVRLLAGEANFSGRLPFTYPRLINSLATYDYKPCENVSTMAGNYDYDAVMDVQWPFGAGLSYTTYRYSRLRCDRAEFTAADRLRFTVDVTNTGTVAGKHGVMLFSSDIVASVTPDVRRLRAFTKVALQPGETRTVTLEVPASDLAFVAPDGHWRLEAGDFRIACGTENLMLHCTATHVWDTPNR